MAIMECWECGLETESIHHHHVVPRCRGGTKTVPLCEPCHSKAHHRSKNMETSRFTKAALQAKKARGERIGRPPKGFKVEAGVLVPNEDFPAVRRCLELSEAGHTYRAIGADLGWNNNTIRRVRVRWHDPTIRSVRKRWNYSTKKLLEFVEEQKRLLEDKLN